MEPKINDVSFDGVDRVLLEAHAMHELFMNGADAEKAALRMRFRGTVPPSAATVFVEMLQHDGTDREFEIARRALLFPAQLLTVLFLLLSPFNLQWVTMRGTRACEQAASLAFYEVSVR
jgi:hypothetical protein